MWKSILYSSNNFEDKNKFLKYKLINILLLTAILISFFMAFLFPLISRGKTEILIVSLELLYGFGNLIFFFLLRYNKINLKSVIYSTITMLYILQVILMFTSVEDSLRQSWFLLTLIISFFLAGKKIGYFILSIIFITLAIYNFQPFIKTNLNTVESVLPLILLLLVGFIMSLYETTKEDYSNSLKETNILLERKIEELNQFNINLESRVKQELTKNRQHEFKLIEQAKMVSMGEMIGNIAHQWRQPLSVISTIATAIKLQKEMDLLDSKLLVQDMIVINNNAQYLSKTIDDFRNFVKDERVKKTFYLTDEISSFLHLVEGCIKNNYIEVKLDLNDSIYMNAYANELKQCFINIFNNSKYALQDFEEKSRLIFIQTYIDGEKVVISIRDNAGGIPEKILPKIFDPYFTTKHQYQGTGLGLSMNYKLIVEGMNGTIKANNIEFIYKNKEYKGIEFKISLPLS